MLFNFERMLTPMTFKINTCMILIVLSYIPAINSRFIIKYNHGI